MLKGGVQNLIVAISPASKQLPGIPETSRNILILISGSLEAKICVGLHPHTGRWVQHRQTNKESNTHTLTLHIQETHRKAPVSPKDPEELAGRGAQHCKVGLSLQPNKKPRRNTKSRRSFPKTMILETFLHCRNACCVVGSSYQTSQNFSNYQ